MTAEQAVVQLKDLRMDREAFLSGDDNGIFQKDITALDVAIEVLSEKAEREKGCNICEEDNCAICQNLGVSIFCEDRELCRHFRKSNYCHWCGRKLRKEAT